MSAEKVLRNYFHAKDENRPHLLERVFCPDARLEIRNRSTRIHFPAVTVGREEIADVLVRRFNQAFENIYSFYLDRPQPGCEVFSCDWLVAMTEKESRSVRVGCGRYDWTFQRTPTELASQLIITIETMLVLDASQASGTMRWPAELNYPWTSAGNVIPTLAADELAPVRAYLGGRRHQANGVS